MGRAWKWAAGGAGGEGNRVGPEGGCGVEAIGGGGWVRFGERGRDDEITGGIFVIKS